MVASYSSALIGADLASIGELGGFASQATLASDVRMSVAILFTGLQT